MRTVVTPGYLVRLGEPTAKILSSTSDYNTYAAVVWYTDVLGEAQNCVWSEMNPINDTRGGWGWGGCGARSIDHVGREDTPVARYTAQQPLVIMPSTDGDFGSTVPAVWVEAKLHAFIT